MAYGCVLEEEVRRSREDTRRPVHTDLPEPGAHRRRCAARGRTHADLRTQTCQSLEPMCGEFAHPGLHGGEHRSAPHRSAQPDREQSSRSTTARQSYGRGRAIRRMSAARLAVLAFGMLLLAQPVATWHAFSDQERMPDVPGTSLRSDLVLPQGLIDKCRAATTSLQKALLVCGVGYPCDFKCATAWNSAMRDTKRVIDMSCRPLEQLINQHMTGDLAAFRVAENSVFQASEWVNLRSWCEHDTMCGKDTDYSPLVNPCSDTEGQCRDGDSRLDKTQCVQLTPPVTTCPVFSFKRPAGMESTACTDANCHKTLTWLSLQEYQKQELGCVGGLSNLGDNEYTTWACIHDISCQFLVSFEDYACFKYSHTRGEFHFWDLNSNLNLVPPLSQVDARFCSADGTSSLKNARTGQPVPLSGVTFLFERVLGDNSLLVYKSGYAPDLGNGGCGTFKLAKRTQYRVQIDAGDAYYKWIGWMYALDTDLLITVGLYPIITGPALTLPCYNTFVSL